MKVFMLGWEFPPFISGGLGTACYGLTKGLDHLGTEIIFVLPRGPEKLQLETSPTTSQAASQRRLGTFRYTRFRTVDAVIRPYVSPGVEDEPEPVAVGARRAKVRAKGPAERVRIIAASSSEGPGGHYGGDLFYEVERYAGLACEIAASEGDFDLVHAHDWMTYPAGIAVADMTGKPLVVHVHSTEFDRSGVHVNQRIYDIERAGMTRAQRVICVSHFTRSIVLQHYGVDPRKVDVVYNAVEENGTPESRTLPPITHDEKIVLFLGRITMQKGPEYFLAAAKRVLEVMGNVRFIMAGSGDMTRRMIELAHQTGIGHKVLFTGFLRGDDVRRVFRMADLYVMPSVSEPFGIAPLEALANDVPVLISKQSGVSEILSHALKVDFWDVDEMANKIIAVLRHPPLQATLRDHGSIEVRRLSWVDSARSCLKVYETAVSPA
ncbi:MAG: glycosyltransferase family 4 protein [Phycisphaerae bacterium]|nr:glycosyltransferase family 4 protein [Phycisphaerae bacterium]